MASKLIGIFGGTFDPIHNGHLHVAHHLLSLIPFEEIRFIPCYEPVHRSTPMFTPEKRLEMCKNALEHEEKLVVDEREFIRKGKSFMIDTLTSLKKDFPESHLALIIGADSFAEFTSWKSWEAILTLTNLVVVNRPDTKEPTNQTLLEKLNTQKATDQNQLIESPAGKIFLAKIPPSPISATRLRKMIAKGEDITNLVPDPTRVVK